MNANKTNKKKVFRLVEKPYYEINILRYRNDF